MRRMLVVWAVVVLCLALGGPSAMAQAAEYKGVAVTGTQNCDFGTGLCTFTASDPRVAGGGTIKNVGEASGPVEGGQIFVWDEVTLEGPEGTWSGHTYVVAYVGGDAQVLIMLSGDGDYEGWQYVATGTDTVPHGDHDLVGVLFEGPVPPIGAAMQGGGE